MREEQEKQKQLEAERRKKEIQRSRNKEEAEEDKMKEEEIVAEKLERVRLSFDFVQGSSIVFSVKNLWTKRCAFYNRWKIFPVNSSKRII